ncbi:NAD-dependent epimerase/dehydratase family protein [Solirubrobacter soli]|uniref:NAD-dependent epimerase/dehydratase family protein n=1 Tax=Solirubrobacter soli TaxID=363832 RepID=UPI0003FD7BD0|nr:NAD(P)-dependent oxidoreductase [Solirubrobacter soli]
MSRVLLTGATGFLGRHVAGRLLAAGHEVHAVTTGEPRDDALVWHRADLLAATDVVPTVRPEVLVHLAWYVEHGKFWSAPENVRWVEASLALLRAFAAAGGQRAVLAGTCAEYDWTDLGDRCEELATPLRPATLYGAAKHGLHTVAAGFAEQAGFELAWGRIFFIYGAGEPAGRLVPGVGRALLAGEQVPTTRGDQVRDFLHVSDAAAAFAALASGHVTGPVNIGSGEPVAVREVVERLAAIAGAPELPRFGALPERPGDPPRLVADARRLREEVGVVPLVGLDEGLARSLEALR